MCYGPCDGVIFDAASTSERTEDLFVVKTLLTLMVNVSKSNRRNSRICICVHLESKPSKFKIPMERNRY